MGGHPIRLTRGRIDRKPGLLISTGEERALRLEAAARGDLERNPYADRVAALTRDERVNYVYPPADRSPRRARRDRDHADRVLQLLAKLGSVDIEFVDRQHWRILPGPRWRRHAGIVGV